MDSESHSCAATRVKGVQHHMGGSSSHQPTEMRTMRLIAGLWSMLPSELLEQVLPFLPVPDLCRYRSVSKRWNSLICTPEFGTLCVQNATKGVKQGPCFVVKLRLCIDSARTGKRCEEISSWSIFDLSAKRWYNVKDELPKGYDYQVAAMDGGLVCTLGKALTDEQRRASTVHNSVTPVRSRILIVSSLIQKGIKVLPNPPWHYINPPYGYINPPYGYINLRETDLKLVVDNISRTYEISLICMDDSWNRRLPILFVYTSSNNQWRFSIIQSRTGKFGEHVCSAMYQGVLHVLFAAPNGLVDGLYSYNYVKDIWEETGVKFWKDDGILVHLCDLLVSDNRLFLMTGQYLVNRRKMGALKFSNRPGHFAENPNPWALDISEILLKGKTSRTVVQMTEAEVYQNFDIQLKDRNDFDIHACGFDKSILLMSEKVHGDIGKYMLYNLVTGLWEFLPSNPAERLHFRSGYRGSMRRDGKTMSYLRLPNTPWC